MKTLSFAQLAVAILSFSSISSALAYPNADADIVRRAEKTTATDKADETSTLTSDAPKKTTTTKATLDTATTHNLNTAADTTTTDKNGKTTTGKTTKGGKTTTTATSHTTYDARDPAGSIVMITPAATADMALFKIGEYATFKWNYTNVQATPTAIDILAECSFASRTYTLTQNMTYATPGSFTWDTAAYQSAHIDSQLVTQEYTLIIYDSDSGVSATAEAGYLGTYSGLEFGMYAPLQYTPLGEWICATCSGALSDTERRALGFALTMSIITVLSFTWFVTGMRLTV